MAKDRVATSVLLTTGGGVEIERYLYHDERYRDPNQQQAVMLRTRSGQSYIAQSLRMDEAITLRDGLTAIIDSIEALRPKGPTFPERMDAAEEGSTVAVRLSGRTYVKEGDRWVNSLTGVDFPSSSFNYPNHGYTLAPPLTLVERMLAAPFGSTVKTSASTYVKVGGCAKNWVNLTSGVQFAESDFQWDPSKYTLTLAE